jgi:Family of unknown function (DUF6404)
MTHREKVACFEQLLKDRGYWISNAIPPACRLLWRIGFETPPPYFLSFSVGVLSAGLPFGILWGAVMWLWPDERSSESVLVSSALVGLFFGLSMAIFWRLQARSLGLPAWGNFPQKPECAA